MKHSSAPPHDTLRPMTEVVMMMMMVSMIMTMMLCGISMMRINMNLRYLQRDFVRGNSNMRP